MKLSYTITPRTISLLVENRPVLIPVSHPNYSALATALRQPEHDLEEIKALANLVTFIARKTFGRVQIADDQVRFNGKPVHNVIAERLIEMLQAGFDLEPLARFLDRLMNNPLESAINELYLWLEAGAMPITPDGCFLAYKAVRQDYRDRHSGTFDNSVGQVCQMPREEVDPDRAQECSRGLHFCSPGYLPNFANSYDRIMIVKIDPADVVAIPRDYNNQKGRTWRYEVVGEVPAEVAADTFFGGAPMVSSYESQVVGIEDEDDDDDGTSGQDRESYTDESRFGDSILSGAEQMTTDYSVAFNQSPPANTTATPVAGNGVDDNSQDDGVAQPAISAKGAQKVAISTTKNGNPKFITSDGVSFTVAQIRKAIKQHGGIRPAARALGVAKSTFQGWAKLV